MSTFLVSRDQDVSCLQRDLQEALFRVSRVKESHARDPDYDQAWDLAISGKHRLCITQGMGMGICSCVRMCVDGTEGARWILAL